MPRPTLAFQLGIELGKSFSVYIQRQKVAPVPPAPVYLNFPRSLFFQFIMIGTFSLFLAFLLVIPPTNCGIMDRVLKDVKDIKSMVKHLGRFNNMKKLTHFVFCFFLDGTTFLLFNSLNTDPGLSMTCRLSLNQNTCTRSSTLFRKIRNQDQGMYTDPNYGCRLLL